jgi:hypothetical protein
MTILASFRPFTPVPPPKGDEAYAASLKRAQRLDHTLPLSRKNSSRRVSGSWNHFFAPAEFGGPDLRQTQPCQSVWGDIVTQDTAS